MKTNFIAIIAAAIVPLILGFIWYGPLLFKTAWMKESQITEEKLKDTNMPLVLGLSFFFSFMLAFSLQMLVIHQWGIFSTLAGEPGFSEGTGEAAITFKNLMQTYGDRFRTFPHGALHGALTALFIIMPIIATIGLFEKKSFKYMAINIGYWVVSLALMGGIVCQWA